MAASRSRTANPTWSMAVTTGPRTSAGKGVLTAVSWRVHNVVSSGGSVMSSGTTVIVAGARTPMGRLLGSLKDFSAADLGGVAIKAALERSGVSPEQVDYVIMGQVIQAGAGQITARQAAVKGGISMDVPAL